MADLPQYTGASYNADLYKKPDETMSDYMLRLAKLRASGVLGGGGMLDITDTPTVVTPAAQELGVLKKNVSSGGESDFNMPVDTRTDAEKLRDAVAIQSGAKSDWGGLLANMLTPFGLGSAIDSAIDKDRADSLRGILEAKAIDEKEIERALNDPQYAQALVESYNKGGLSFDGIPAEGLLIDPIEAGSAFTYKLDNLGDTIKGWFGFGPEKAADPFLTTVTAVPEYGKFTNFLAQQAPAFNVSNGMLSNIPVTPDMPNYIVDTGSGITTSGSYNDSGDWSWSGTDFSAPSTTADGNDWSSW